MHEVIIGEWILEVTHDWGNGVWKFKMETRN